MAASWVPMPIVPGPARVDDRAMTEAATTTMALVASPRSGHGTTPHMTTENPSMAEAGRRLAEAAAAFRAAAATPRDGSDVALSFSRVEAALDDLAAGAELSAYAVTEAGRPDGVPATHAAPTSARRSLAWRLHGLRRALLAAREVCAEANRVLRIVARD
jgi:hypothetical protein